jgi:uncharacterized membrane protein
MSELIVAGFKGTQRAAEVLDQIVERNSELAIHLKDAVAVYRTNSGKLRVDSSFQPTSKEGALAGATIGIIIGSLLALPFTAGASAAVAAGALGTGAFTFGATGAVIAADDTAEDKEKYGISEDLVKKIGGMVQPGESAVFVLANASNPKKVAEAFRGYGATILTTSLHSAEAQRLQQVVGPAAATVS